MKRLTLSESFAYGVLKQATPYHNDNWLVKWAKQKIQPRFEVEAQNLANQMATRFFFETPTAKNCVVTVVPKFEDNDELLVEGILERFPNQGVVESLNKHIYRRYYFYK